MFYFPRARVFNPFRDLTIARLILLLILAVWLALVFAGFGWAQDAATTSVTVAPAGAVNPGNVISLAPLITLAFQVFAAIILGVVSVYTPIICTRLATMLHVNVDQTMLDRVKSAAQTATAAMFAKAEDMAAIKNASFTVQSPEVAAIANAALSKVPDAVAHLGLTPDHMKDIVLGEIGKMQAAGTPAALPAAAAK